MALPDPLATSSPFLALPTPIRHRIYEYLYPASPQPTTTTINYSLAWPWLDNPSNSTFAGPTQIDRCKCPRRWRRSSTSTKKWKKTHIYSRFECQPPEIRFTGTGGDDGSTADEPLWMLVRPAGPFNFLRPAEAAEKRAQRPGLQVARTCKKVCDEVLPYLYRGRSFLLLTGPCPRGRYQAYATRVWLQRLSRVARQSVGALTVVCQKYEEDCDLLGAVRAYRELGEYVVDRLPGLEVLNVCMADAVQRPVLEFARLCGTRGMRLRVERDWKSGSVVEFEHADALLRQMGGLEISNHHDVDGQSDSSEQSGSKNSTRVQVRAERRMRRMSRSFSSGESIKDVAIETKGPEVVECQEIDHEQPGVENSAQTKRRRDKMKFGYADAVGHGKEVRMVIKDEPRSPEDDWVLAKLSPTGLEGESEDENWEFVGAES